MMPTIGSNVSAAAATQSSSLKAGSNSTDPNGTVDNPITFVDSSDDDIRSGAMSKAINHKEMVSLYLAI